MAEIPQPPSPGKGFFVESEPLKAYHGLLSPFFDQIRGAFGGLTLKENHGAVVTDTATITSGADGLLTGVFVAAGFTPLLVFFRAEELDATKRPTGSVIGGAAYWSTNPRSGEQGFQVLKAPGLTTSVSYAMTFVALPG